MRRTIVLSYVLALVAPCVTNRLLLGSEYTIVIPAEYENKECPDSSLNTDTEYSEGWRAQVFYPASLFDSLSETHRWLTAVRLRPDGNLTGPVAVDDHRIVLSYSTTSKDFRNLSQTFDENMGPDRMLVLDGLENWSTANTGPAGGPKEFDIIRRFETPFYYDPNEGNLLVDVTFPEGFTLVNLDGVRHAPPSWLFASDPTSPVVEQSGGGDVIVQFVFEDEPLSTKLMAGDANMDLKFDQLDLVQVLQAGKYMTGEAATWGEGDWNGAPGGRVGEPPPGDGVFNQLDIVYALNANTYLTGPYAAVPVPEPAAILLALAGLLCLAVVGRLG